MKMLLRSGIGFIELLDDSNREQRALHIDYSLMLESPAFPPHLQALVGLARLKKAV
jgi:hypothetical protein